MSNFYNFKKKIIQAQDVLNSLTSTIDTIATPASNDETMEIYELSEDDGQMNEEHLKFADNNYATPVEVEQILFENDEMHKVSSPNGENQMITNKSAGDKRKNETNVNRVQNKRAKIDKSNEEKVTIQMNECLICPSILDDIIQLADHIALHKNIQCKACNRSFARYSNLKRHFNSSHSKPKPFQCDICGLGFSFSVNLQTHAEIHYKSKIRMN